MWEGVHVQEARVESVNAHLTFASAPTRLLDGNMPVAERAALKAAHQGD